LRDLDFKQVEAFDIETLGFLPEFENATYDESVYTLKTELGLITVTWMDDQWLITIDNDLFVIERLGDYNCRLTMH
jgi:hypothetical protein